MAKTTDFSIVQYQDDDGGLKFEVDTTTYGNNETRRRSRVYDSVDDVVASIVKAYGAGKWVKQ